MGYGYEFTEEKNRVGKSHATVHLNIILKNKHVWLFPSPILPTFVFTCLYYLKTCFVTTHRSRIQAGIWEGVHKESCVFVPQSEPSVIPPQWETYCYYSSARNPLLLLFSEKLSVLAPPLRNLLLLLLCEKLKKLFSEKPPVTELFFSGKAYVIALQRETICTCPSLRNHLYLPLIEEPSVLTPHWGTICTCP